MGYIKKSKYRAVRTEVDGIKFASKKEATRYQQLKLLQMAGVITELQLQVPFVLIKKSQYGAAVKYIADFVYYENGRYVVEDTKGYRTDVYKLKRRLLQETKGITIKET